MATTHKANRSELNELRRNDGAEQGAQSRVFPEHLAKHYHRDGNSYRSALKPEKIEFVDRGSRMHAYRPVSAFTARTMAEIAAARQWSSVLITGDRDWGSKAFVELADRGVHVDGYQPTTKDKEILGRREERREALSNPKVQAFLTAQDGAAMADAVTRYPDLKDAFAFRAAIQKKGAEIADVKGQQNWVTTMTSKVVLALHKGEKLPTVSVRGPAESSRDRGNDSAER